MKIAIVQDELVRRGGGERVALCFHQTFPEAPVYTLAYNSNRTYSGFKSCRVITSWFQKITTHPKIMRLAFFPLGIIAMRQLDLTGFDVVLMSSTHCAKYVSIQKEKSLVINFCHCPFRLAWDSQSYLDYAKGRGLKKWILKKIIYILRKIDYNAARHVDYFIANTAEMADRIKKTYHPIRPISVIHPPVFYKKFYISPQIKDYYLVVSRFEYYKRVDLAISAFNVLQLPLIVVGEGTYRVSLMKLAKNNIIFKDKVDDIELAELYSKCKALIFPQKEDYGITPLEANASGRPVIAFGKGGVLETMIPYHGDAGKATSLFFNEQTVDALVKAVQCFQSLHFDPLFVRAHALKFDSSHFIDAIRSFVYSKYKNWGVVSQTHQKKTVV